VDLEVVFSPSPEISESHAGHRDRKLRGEARRLTSEHVEVRDGSLAQRALDLPPRNVVTQRGQKSIFADKTVAVIDETAELRGRDSLGEISRARDADHLRRRYVDVRADVRLQGPSKGQLEGRLVLGCDGQLFMEWPAGLVHERD